MSTRLREAAPLLATKAAPVPPGAEATWLEGARGVRLRAGLFRPPGAPRGSVVLSPGRTEFIEKYFEVIGELQSRGFVALVHDWRGQGLSDRLHADGLRGHADGVDDFLVDFARVLDAFADRLPRPWINLAHSMGGGLTNVALARGERRFDGQVLSAPMFGLDHMGVPSMVADAALDMSLATGGASRWALQIEPGGGRLARLSHDPVRLERWLEQMRLHPQLAIGGLTWGWLEMARQVRRALLGDALSRVTLPTVLLLAGGEAAVDNGLIRSAARIMPDAKLVEFPGSWHEILMETDAVRAGAWQAFDALAARVAPRPPSG